MESGLQLMDSSSDWIKGLRRDMSEKPTVHQKWNNVRR